MAASITSVKKAGDKRWEYTWSGTAPFRVFNLDTGEQEPGDRDLAEGLTNDTSRRFDNSDDLEPPVIVVMDSTETGQSLSEINPAYATIQWRGVSDVDFYEVEQNVSAVWTVVGRERHDAIRYYSVRTPVLADVTTHNFRVSGTDNAGNQSATIQIDVFMSRNPPAPSVTNSYSNPTLTVAAR